MSIFKVFLFSLFLIGASTISIDHTEAKPKANQNTKAKKTKMKDNKIKTSKKAKIKNFNGKKFKVSAVGNSIKIEALGAKSAKVCCQKSCQGYNVSCHAYNCKKNCKNGCQCGGSNNSVYGEFIKQ